MVLHPHLFCLTPQGLWNWVSVSILCHTTFPAHLWWIFRLIGKWDNLWCSNKNSRLSYLEDKKKILFLFIFVSPEAHGQLFNIQWGFNFFLLHLISNIYDKNLESKIFFKGKNIKIGAKKENVMSQQVSSLAAVY